jgi:hypothetical protein
VTVCRIVSWIKIQFAKLFVGSASEDQFDQEDNRVVQWLQLLVAGPLVVNYVNNLLVHASKRDFPLTYPVNYVFQHIKDPTSFRSVLV